MTVFNVNYHDVDTFSSGIYVLARAATKASAYSANIDYDPGVGEIFSYLYNLDDSTRVEVKAAFDYLHKLSAACGKELHVAAHYYHYTDHETAIHEDKTYPR